MKFEYANVKYGSIILKNKKSDSVFKVLLYFWIPCIQGLKQVRRQISEHSKVFQ